MILRVGMGVVLLTATLAACQAPPPTLTPRTTPRRLLAVPAVLAPDPALGTRLWATGHGVVRGTDGSSIALSLSVQQSPATGRLEGTVFVNQSDVANRSYMGIFTGGTLAHAAGGGGSAHLTGVSAEGEAFTLDLVDANDATVPDTVHLQIPGQLALAGLVTFGDLRVLRALPVGQDFRAAPGAVFDYQVGLFVFAEDEADLRVGPQTPVPARVLEAVAPDGIELPNGRMPGNLNAVAGIGWDVPTFVADLPVFPSGVPVFADNQPFVIPGFFDNEPFVGL